MSGGGYSPPLRERLRQRLRRAPNALSVPGSLPVLFFGQLGTGRAATVGLNPSDREYLDRHGNELTGSAQRFHTLGSLGATERRTLTDDQCDRAIGLMH